jgi:hypothetical protein
MATKGLQNIALTYNSNAMAAHLDSASLEAVVNAIGTTTFASAAEETSPGATKYSVPVGGPWSKALDDILGADAVSPPSTLRSLVYQVGPVGNRVTYTWTGSATVGAFVADYKILADDPLGNIKWSGTLNISGAPTRV